MNKEKLIFELLITLLIAVIIFNMGCVEVEEVPDVTVRGTILINGSALSQDISSYNIEVGEGQTPGNWSVTGVNLTSNGTISMAGVLGSIDTTVFNDGKHTIKLSVTDNNNVTSYDLMFVTIDNIFITSPAEGDILRRSTLVDITGTVTGTKFMNYTIKYGYGSAPSEWLDMGITLTDNGTSKIDNGTLAIWNTSVLSQTGRYVIRLDVNNINGSNSFIRENVSIDLVDSWITFPVDSDIIDSGALVNITGTANTTNFQNYTIEHGYLERYCLFDYCWYDTAPSEWSSDGITLVGAGTSAISNKTLAFWNTSVLINDGIYMLKLVTSDTTDRLENYTLSLQVLSQTGWITSPANNSIVNETITIEGTATGINFMNYTIEYGYGTTPSEWLTQGLSLTNNGTSRINEGILGVWNTSFLNQTGRYMIKLTVNNINDYVSEYYVPVNRFSYQAGWPKSVDGTISSMVIGDIDKDNSLEIVAAYAELLSGNPTNTI